jgi:hypothetical protein
MSLSATPAPAPTSLFPPAPAPAMLDTPPATIVGGIAAQLRFDANN